MKYRSWNWKTAIGCFIMLALLAGCVKAKNESYKELSDSNGLVILPNSGLINFWGDAYLYIFPFSPDTVRVQLYAGLSSNNALAEDIFVTVAIDDAKRIAFNTDNPWASYLAPTNDMYTLKDTKIVIKAGKFYGSAELELYTQNIDFNQSWMLPISITDASGKSLTSNLNTMYYHIN